MQGLDMEQLEKFGLGYPKEDVTSVYPKKKGSSTYENNSVLSNNQEYVFSLYNTIDSMFVRGFKILDRGCYTKVIKYLNNVGKFQKLENPEVENIEDTHLLGHIYLN